MGGWKGRWLTKVGRTTMIKLVLSAITTYHMSCLLMPKGIKRKLDSKLKNFFWQGIEEKKKLALIKWDNICKL